MGKKKSRKAGGPNPPGPVCTGLWAGLEVGEGRTAVRLQTLRQGRDWLIQVSGGQAHIGAVATADEEKVQLAVVGQHKEGPLAKLCARRWAQLTGQVSVAVVGIHQDRATAQEIEDIVGNVEQGLAELMASLQEAEDGI